MKKVYSIIFLIFCFIILAVSIRGLPGNPTTADLLTAKWRSEGPFELSPERGRYAITYSVIEDGSVLFSPELARFVLPDVGFRDGNYVSLFAPALSFITIPGYLLGQVFGFAQVGSFAVITVFALLNTLLIKKISVLLGAGQKASILASLVFLFSTPAYAYAVNLYQHHVTTALILLSLLLTIKKQNLISYILIFFMFALGVSLDYPNFFILSPFIIQLTFNKIINIKNKNNEVILKLRPQILVGLIGVVIPLAFFLGFNYISYGSPLNMLGGSSIETVSSIDKDGLPSFDSEYDEFEPEIQESYEGRSRFSYLKARNMVNGLYIHLLSPDRGVLYFTPVIFIGVVGIFVLYKSRNKHLPLLLSIVGINLILYSMWGDPWGGWAFGSRYLIPSYAIMSIFIAMALTKYSRNILFLLVFAILFVYSTAINTLGAITTSAIPPKVQAIPLEALTGREEKYNYRRSWDYLNQNGSKSFVYQTYLEDIIDARDFYTILVVAISLVALGTLTGVYLTDKKTKDGNKD